MASMEAPMDDAARAKLAKFNAQFQRSVASPLSETINTPRLELDGSVVLQKYVGGADAGSMSGAEFYAMVGHIKRQQGARGEALEAELMKINRQKDKKLRLAAWVNENIAPAQPATMYAPASPAPRGIPEMPRLDLGGAQAM